MESNIRPRRAARAKTATLGREVWGTLAIRRQVAFAAHVARLPEEREVNIVQWE